MFKCYFSAMKSKEQSKDITGQKKSEKAEEKKD